MRKSPPKRESDLVSLHYIARNVSDACVIRPSLIICALSTLQRVRTVMSASESETDTAPSFI